MLVASKDVKADWEISCQNLATERTRSEYTIGSTKSLNKTYRETKGSYKPLVTGQKLYSFGEVISKIKEMCSWITSNKNVLIAVVLVVYPIVSISKIHLEINVKIETEIKCYNTHMNRSKDVKADWEISCQNLATERTRSEYTIGSTKSLNKTSSLTDPVT